VELPVRLGLIGWFNPRVADFLHWYNVRQSTKALSAALHRAAGPSQTSQPNRWEEDTCEEEGEEQTDEEKELEHQEGN